MKCTKCNEDKSLSNFYKRPDRETGHQSYCKQCFNTYCRDRWIKLKIKAIHYKGGKCMDCDRLLDDKNPYYLFDFHHLDPSKKDCEWKQLKSRSWNKITIELDKCVCVCVICHRHREHKLNL